MNDIMKKSIHCAWMIVKLVVPVAIICDILNHIGLTQKVSFLFEPLTAILQLPPETALSLAAGFFFNLYAGIAVAASLGLNAFEWTIVGTFLAICHSIPLEAAVLKKVKYSASVHIALRLAAALVGAWAASHLTSTDLASIQNSVVALTERPPFFDMLLQSLISAVTLAAKITVLVLFLVVSFELLRNWSPVKRFLDRYTFVSSLSVGGLLGVTYGAGILLKDIENVSPRQKSLVLTFLVLAHGLIEETLIFGFFHADLWMIFAVRTLLALFAVGVLFGLYKLKDVKWTAGVTT